MKINLSILFIFLNGFLLEQEPNLDQYNPVWTMQSKNSSESMPCGGGDVGLNVWVGNGELLFYIARSGTFDENNLMPKLGRVRIKMSPNPLNGEIFKQELDLKEGCVRISGKEGDHSIQITVWLDVFSPVIHVDFESNQKTDVEATYESWRYEDRLVRKPEGFGNSYKWAIPDGLITKKDEIGFEENSVLFFHHNSGETVFDVSVTQQQMEAVKNELFDPLKNLTFGGKMTGENFVSTGTGEGKYLSTEFKLHAPGKTTVEAEYKNGEVKVLNVEPNERMKDIEILLKN